MAKALQVPSQETTGNVVGILYERPILSKIPTNFSDQVYDILVELIQKGYWRIGERLPGRPILARESGLSQFPIHLALNRLAEEGYIRRDGKRGSFLVSMFPQGRKMRGTIGLAIFRDLLEAPNYAISDKYHVPLMHQFHEVAREHNFASEVYFYDSDDDLSLINSPDGPFGSRVRGVVVVGRIPNFNGMDLSGGRVPTVFIGFPKGNCTPNVWVNHKVGMYLLTEQLIKAGHREIAVFCEPANSVSAPAELVAMHDQALEANLLTPHRAAMDKAGLAVNEEAIAMSRNLPYSSPGFVRDFLEKFSDATVIIGLRNSPVDLVGVAEMMGLRVPEDLSIVSAHTGLFPMHANDPSRLITGMDPLHRGLMEEAIARLEEIQNTGFCRYSEVLLTPLFTEGASLAPPRARV